MFWLSGGGLAAPEPGRGEGRFTQTVAMPSDCAGITSSINAAPDAEPMVTSRAGPFFREFEYFHA